MYTGGHKPHHDLHFILFILPFFKKAAGWFLALYLYNIGMHSTFINLYRPVPSVHYLTVRNRITNRAHDKTTVI